MRAGWPSREFYQCCIMAQVRLGKLKKMWQNQQKGGQNSVRSGKDMKGKD